MITGQQAEVFWSVVAECLVRFHAHPVTLACKEVAEYRAHLAEAPKGMRRGMVYHSEPFEVASRIAGDAVQLSDVAQEYAAMMEAAFPFPSESLAMRERRARYGPDR
ncbi:MAG: hypothetical protein AVDCRST_MAG68-701 [uncultured Gemmatimonadetes bacterium]|uniref:Uncharacterized protein n=1 Tax=uncultured Gemmatimonadota bacterium TaxID=203437 RepID=A0A6J4KE20_9BACT|nr:MAG: hypothetical protein AVDCRST_MAG68-701 [uncultured Gemmatimonadota bacterium]